MVSRKRAVIWRWMIFAIRLPSCGITASTSSSSERWRGGLVGRPAPALKADATLAFRAGSVPCQRPAHMFAHQLRGVIEPTAECLDHRDAGMGVAQTYGQIAQPAFVADAAQR